MKGVILTTGRDGKTISPRLHAVYVDDAVLDIRYPVLVRAIHHRAVLCDCPNECLNKAGIQPMYLEVYAVGTQDCHDILCSVRDVHIGRE